MIVVQETEPAFILGSSAVSCKNHTTNLLELSLHIVIHVEPLHVRPSLRSTSDHAVISVHDTVHALQYILSHVDLLYHTTNVVVLNATAANVPSVAVALDTATAAPTLGVLCAKLTALAYTMLSADF